MDNQPDLNQVPETMPTDPVVNMPSYSPESLNVAKKKTVGPIIGLIAVVLLLVGGLTYAFMEGLLPGIGGAPFSNDEIIVETVDMLSTIESGKFMFDIAIDVSPKDSDVYPFPDKLTKASNSSFSQSYSALTLMGSQIPSDFSLALGIGSTFNIDSQKGSAGKSQLTFSLDLDDFIINADLEFMIDGLDAVYLKVNRMPSVVMDAGPIKGEWVKITSDEMEALGYPSLEEFDTEMNEEARQQLEEVQKMIKETFKIMSETKVVESVGSPKKVVLDGESLYKYTLKANSENFEEYRRALVDLYKDSEIFSEVAEKFLNEEDMQLYGTQAYVDYYNTHFPWSIWATGGGEIRKIGIEGRIVLPEDDVPKLADKQINVDISLRLDDINESLKINAPEDSLTLDEVAELLPAVRIMVDRAKEQARARVKFPVQTVVRNLDIYYSTERRYPDSLAALEDFLFNQEMSRYGRSYHPSFDEGVLYKSTQNSLGFVACSPHLDDGDLYYCETESFKGSVPLSEVGEPTDSLADMHDAINEAINTGKFISPEERDEVRKESVRLINQSFARSSYDASDTSVAWKKFTISRDRDVFGLDDLPEYVKITHKEVSYTPEKTDYVLCSRYESKPDTSWCMDSKSYAGYELED